MPFENRTICELIYFEPFENPTRPVFRYPLYTTKYKFSVIYSYGEALKTYLGLSLLFLCLQSFSLLIPLGLHLVIVWPEFLPAILNELGAQTVKLANQIQNFLDEKASVADARFPENDDDEAKIIF